MRLIPTILIIILLLVFGSVMAADEVQQKQEELKGAIDKSKQLIKTTQPLTTVSTVNVDKVVPTTPDKAPAKDAPAQKQDHSKQTQPQTTPQQAQSTPDTYEYIFIGKRDPFSPLIKQETDKKKGAPLSPLEGYFVNDIKVVGILEKNAEYIAQIVLPDGKSYTIRPGQKLGLMGGIVSNINKETVLIKEKGIDAEGKPVIKNITLRLRKEEE